MLDRLHETRAMLHKLLYHQRPVPIGTMPPYDLKCHRMKLLEVFDGELVRANNENVGQVFQLLFGNKEWRVRVRDRLLGNRRLGLRRCASRTHVDRVQDRGQAS